MPASDGRQRSNSDVCGRKGAAKAIAGDQTLIFIQLQSHRDEQYVEQQGMKAG
jgi:hypothetical protein